MSDLGTRFPVGFPGEQMKTTLISASFVGEDVVDGTRTQCEAVIAVKVYADDTHVVDLGADSVRAVGWRAYQNLIFTRDTKCADNAVNRFVSRRRDRRSRVSVPWQSILAECCDSCKTAASALSADWEN